MSNLITLNEFNKRYNLKDYLINNASWKTVYNIESLAFYYDIMEENFNYNFINADSTDPDYENIIKLSFRNIWRRHIPNLNLFMVGLEQLKEKNFGVNTTGSLKSKVINNSLRQKDIKDMKLANANESQTYNFNELYNLGINTDPYRQFIEELSIIFINVNIQECVEQNFFTIYRTLISYDNESIIFDTIDIKNKVSESASTAITYDPDTKEFSLKGVSGGTGTSTFKTGEKVSDIAISNRNRPLPSSSNTLLATDLYNQDLNELSDTINTKANINDVYTKTATNTLLDTKANKHETYTKLDVDTRLNTKQNTLTAGANITIVNDVISATGGGTGTAWGQITGNIDNQTDLKNAFEVVNNTLATKADKTTTYTKLEVDTALNLKANISEVVKLTGNQTVDGIKTFNSSARLYGGATIRNGLNMQNAKITTLADGVLPTDAVNLRQLTNTLANKANDTLNNIQVLPQVASTTKAMFRDSDGRVKEAPVSAGSTAKFKNNVDLNTIDFNTNDYTDINIFSALKVNTLYANKTLENTFAEKQTFSKGADFVGNLGINGSLNLQGNQIVQGNIVVNGNIDLNTIDAMSGGLNLWTNPAKTNGIFFDDYSAKPRISWKENSTVRATLTLSDTNDFLIFNVPIEGKPAGNPNEFVVLSQLPNLTNYGRLDSQNTWTTTNIYGDSNANITIEPAYIKIKNGTNASLSLTAAKSTTETFARLKENTSDKLIAYTSDIPINTYSFTTNFSATTTAINASVNLKTLMDATAAGVFDDWVANKTNYTIEAYVQSKAGTSSFQSVLKGTGSTEIATNANLFYTSSGLNNKITWEQDGEVPFQAFWMGNTGGAMRFYVRFNNAWNANFTIRKIIVYKVG